MDNFRQVPDGQYTQTIYSLIRDQKYKEVRSLSLSSSHCFVLECMANLTR